VLGPWLTKLGRYEEAESEYKRLSEFPREYGIDYLKASNDQAWGNTLWGRGEQGKALATFEKGLVNLDKAISVPKGTSDDALQDTRRKLLTKIEFLKKAGVQSSEDEP
jgi:tetratricopeptide (TPR) repeat protein